MWPGRGVGGRRERRACVAGGDLDGMGQHASACWTGLALKPAPTVHNMFTNCLCRQVMCSTLCLARYPSCSNMLHKQRCWCGVHPRQLLSKKCCWVPTCSSLQEMECLWWVVGCLLVTQLPTQDTKGEVTASSKFALRWLLLTTPVSWCCCMRFDESLRSPRPLLRAKTSHKNLPTSHPCNVGT